jgi:hypothetical protein
VHLVAGKTIGGAELAWDAGQQLALQSFQLLKFGLTGGQFRQERFTSAETEVSSAAALMRALR